VDALAGPVCQVSAGHWLSAAGRHTGAAHGHCPGRGLPMLFSTGPELLWEQSSGRGGGRSQEGIQAAAAPWLKVEFCRGRDGDGVAVCGVDPRASRPCCDLAV